MGGTIPLLTQALTRGLADATRIHAFVYAFNTAGAFVGSLAAGFVLIHWLGLDGVLRAMGAVNLFAGRRVRGARPAAQRRLPASRRPRARAAQRAVPRSFAALALVALLAGFAMMVLQTTLNRVAGLALGSSHFTFAMVVAVFVLCIALGSFAVSALSRIPRLAGGRFAVAAGGAARRHLPGDPRLRLRRARAALLLPRRPRGLLSLPGLALRRRSS